MVVSTRGSHADKLLPKTRVGDSCGSGTSDHRTYTHIQTHPHTRTCPIRITHHSPSMPPESPEARPGRTQPARPTSRPAPQAARTWLKFPIRFRAALFFTCNTMVKDRHTRLSSPGHSCATGRLAATLVPHHVVGILLHRRRAHIDALDHRPLHVDHVGPMIHLAWPSVVCNWLVHWLLHRHKCALAWPIEESAIDVGWFLASPSLGYGS